MRSDHVRIVRDTWALAEPHAHAIGLLFYARLFEIDPSLRFLFPPDLRGQTTRLMQTLGVAVGVLDRLDKLGPTLEVLGRRHVEYGVRDADYDTVGRALLDTLAATFGDAFTASVREAWTETYDALAGVMRRAGREEEAIRADARRYRLIA